MSAAKIVGLASGPIWGVPNTPSMAGQSAEYGKGGEVTQLKDGNSRVIAAAYHSPVNTLSYRAKIKTAAYLTEVFNKARGSAITIDGVAAYLDKVTRTKTEGDFAEINIDLQEYPDFSS